MPGTLIVLSGPPLPGRWLLARTLQARLGARRFSWQAALDAAQLASLLEQGGFVIVDGDLPTERERRRLLDQHRDAERVLVSWSCSRPEAEREIFHRYAARPRGCADAELERYLADAERREPIGAELAEELLVRMSCALPLHDQVLSVLSALAPRRSAPTPEAARRPSVLVVEDVDEERAVLAEVLDELGYDVELAPDAAVALALLDEGAEIDVVLTDQRMPGLSGVELARELAMRHPRVITILLTGHSEDALCADAVSARAVAVLKKPVHVIDLVRVLDEARAEAHSVSR